MSFKTEPLQPAHVPGAYARYPLVLHRGEHPNIQSRRAANEAEEAEALANGWSLQRPPVPEPEPEKPVLSLEERVLALESDLASLGSAFERVVEALEEMQEKAKRGPGRPKKEGHDAS